MIPIISLGDNFSPVFVRPDKLENKTAAIAQEKVAAENKFIAKVDGELKVAASGKLKAAEKKISKAKLGLAKVEKSKVSTNTSPVVDAKIKIAEEAVVSGRSQLNSGATAAAFTSFQEAHQAAQEAEILIDSDVSLKTEILKIKDKGQIKLDLGL